MRKVYKHLTVFYISVLQSWSHPKPYIFYYYRAAPITLPITLIKSNHIIINMVRLCVSLLAIALAAGPALAFSEEYER